MNLLDMLNKKNEEDEKYEFEKPEFEPVSVADNFISNIDAPEMLEETPPRDPLAEGASDLSPFYANTTQDSEEDDNMDKGGEQQGNNLETLYKEYMANIGSRQQQIKDAAEADRRKRLIQNLSNAFSKIGTGLASGYANVKINPIDLGPADEEAKARAAQKGQLEDLLTQYKIKKAMTPEQMSKLDQAKLAKEKALAAKYKAEKERMEAPQSEMEKVQLQTAQEELKQLREPKKEKEKKDILQSKMKEALVDDYIKIQEKAKEATAQDFNLDEAIQAQLDFTKNTIFGTGGLYATIPFTNTSPMKSLDRRAEQLDAKYKQLSLDKLKTFSGMSKTLDSDSERLAFEQTNPNIKNEDATNLKIMIGAKAINHRIKAEANMQKKYYEENKTLEGYKSSIEDKPTTVVVDKNGKFKLIERKQLDLAKKSGFLTVDEYAESLIYPSQKVNK